MSILSRQECRCGVTLSQRWQHHRRGNKTCRWQHLPEEIRMIIIVIMMINLMIMMLILIWHGATLKRARQQHADGNNMQVATSLCFQHSKHSTQNPFAIHSIPFGRTLDMNLSFSVVLLSIKCC